MKTSWTLKVKYKIPVYNDSKLLSTSVRDLVKAHLDHIDEVGIQATTEGRIQIPGKGVIEYKIDDFYDKISGNG